MLTEYCILFIFICIINAIYIDVRSSDYVVSNSRIISQL
jgi:hypothetical protein